MLALAALAAALLTAACSNSDNTGSGTPTSAPATSAAADNTKEVCAAAEKAITDGQQQFATELQKAMSAQGADQTTAIQALKTLFGQWVTSLRAEAAKATNPELKTALTTFSDELQKAADNINTPQDLQNFDMDSPAMKSASDTLDRLCG